MSSKAVMTYWLYYGARPLTSVRLPVGSTEVQIRHKALEWHDRLPMPDQGFAPFEWEQMLWHAQIRSYADGR